MEETSHIAHYMYELELAYLEGQSLADQKGYIETLKTKGQFPPDLELLDFMYDGAQGSNTGTSGAAFRDKRSGKYSARVVIFKRHIQPDPSAGRPCVGV